MSASVVGIDMSEVAKHNNQDSCWVVIKGEVYDVTEFLPEHPGGASIILRYGGKDATEEYEPVHPPGTLESELPKEKHLGVVRPSPHGILSSTPAPSQTKSQLSNRPLSLCLNLGDFEVVARQKLSKRAWIYYSSASEDAYSHGQNRKDWQRIHFRPRVMRDVHTVRMQRTVLGHPSAFPVYIAPAALARLGHPDGEMCLARGAGKHNIPYAVSTASSVAFEDLSACVGTGRGNGTLWFQLYVKKQRSETEALIRRAKTLGFTALLVTVDTAAVGAREDDDRYKAELAVEAGESVPVPFSTMPLSNEETPAYRAPYSSRLNWNDLVWIREAWADAGPIALKGIATAEDAKLCMENGVQCVYLSNHGGRQLDGAPSSIRTLLEIRRYCPEVLTRCQILLDGGVRRGSDVVKALCLGATAVGLGRPFMYALSGYGTEGVAKAIEILGHEIETCMRLLGVSDVNDLGPHMVNALTLIRETHEEPLGDWRARSRSRL